MNHAEQTELKNKTVEKLAEYGIWANRHGRIDMLAEKVEKATGIKRHHKEIPSQYLRKWLGIEAQYSAVNPRYVPPNRPLVVRPHPRAQDIDRAQPRMWTPCAPAGNDFMRRGL